MRSSNSMETITIGDEAINIDPPSEEEDSLGNCRHLCIAQYKEDADNAESLQSRADHLVKTEPGVKLECPDDLDISGSSGTLVKNRMAPGTDNLYSAKCEMICTTENDEHKGLQFTPSTSTENKAEDNFEFISVENMKQDVPQWRPEREDANPNPFLEWQMSAQQQGNHLDSSCKTKPSTAGDTDYSCTSTPKTNSVIYEEMNHVANLLKVNFSALPLRDKVKIKGLGPHQPELGELIHKETKSGKEFRRHFNNTWYQKKPWLCGCEEKNALFCFPCTLFKGDSSWTKTGIRDLKHLTDKIKCHEYSISHINNCTDLAMLGCVSIAEQLDTGYRNSIKKINEQVDKNRYILFKMIDCIKFCGTFELALRGHDETVDSINPGIFLGLVDFIADIDSALKTHLEGATVFKGTSKTIQNDLLDCMLTVYYEEVRKEIQHAKYVAIQADETTDFSSRLQLALIFRYEVNGTVVERFWKFLNPIYANAEGVAEILLSELNNVFGSDREKLIGQTFDGAAVMSGVKGGVQTIIQETYPNAHYVHCYAHQLNLVMQQSTLKIKELRVFFLNLSGFSAFFSHSPQRMKVFLTVLARRIHHTVPTCCNFNSRLVCTVFEQRDELIDCLNQISENGDFDVVTVNQATALCSYLERETFVYWLTLFNEIMRHVDILDGQVQKINTDPVQISNSLIHFCETIQNIRDRVNSENADWEKCKRPRMNRVAVAKEVCDTIIYQAKQRFSYSGHLMASKLLFTDKFKLYSKKFPEEEFKYALEAYPFLERTRLRNELKTLYKRRDFQDSKGAVPLLQLFVDNNLQDTYSEVCRLLRILVTTPMCSSECERCFSTLKRIKTFLRCTMKDERLNALAILSIEKEFVRSLPDFNKRVTETFAQKKNRRVDFLFKTYSTP